MNAVPALATTAARRVSLSLVRAAPAKPRPASVAACPTHCGSCNLREVCVIPYARLEELNLQRQLHKVMSRELVRDQGVMMLLGTMRAEERLAAFLLNLSQRFVARGFSPHEFHLRMTRDEIGSYLGLSLETVSRLFSRFQEDNLITVQQKHICILDVPGLRAVMVHENE